MAARPLSIRWWLGGLVAGVALPLLVLLVWIYALQVHREEKEAREGALRFARATGARMRLLHQDSLALLQRMATRPPIRNFERPGCDNLFAIVDFLPQYADLLLYDNLGNLVCSATPAAEDQAMSEQARQWIHEALVRQRLRPGEPLIRPIDQRWVSALSTNVHDPDGHKRGTLVLIQLPEILGGDTLAPGTVLTIIDRSGTVVARSESSHKWTGRNVRGLGVTDVVLREKEGVTEARGLDGVSRQYGFQYLPELGWYIYVGVPTAVVMQPVRQMFVRGVAGGTLIILVLALVAALFSRRVERPLGSLARAAQSVARGSYGHVPTSEGPREIVTLAESFNHMVNVRSESEQRMQEDERKLKALSDRLLVIQEEERSRIARELHDDLGQSLTALKMDVIGLLEKTVPDARRSPIAERILRTLDATVTSVQRISSELRPSILDDLGLAAALESEARLFEERTGIECELSMSGDDAIETRIATAVYRIVQEALTNVARHANATRVEIRLREWPDAIVLEIRDDGRGVTDHEVADPLSLGLIGIRERADLAGGVVHFEGVAGRGTIVSVRIPIAQGSRASA